MAQMRRPGTGVDVPFDDDQRLPGGGRLPMPSPEIAPEMPMAAPNPTGEGGTARGGETPRERSGETPRQRASMQGVGSVPPSPMEPTVRAGQPGIPTFSPMPPVPGVSLAKPRGMGSLFGSAGGLQGGGLGLPFDPVSNQKSLPIDGLIQMLKKGTGGGF